MSRKDVGMVAIERGGVTYHGAWSIAKDIDTITVTLIRGASTTTQLAGSASVPESLAKIMLRELVDARASKRKLK